MILIRLPDDARYKNSSFTEAFCMQVMYKYISLNNIYEITALTNSSCEILTSKDRYLLPTTSAEEFINMIEKQIHGKQFNIKMDEILK